MMSKRIKGWQKLAALGVLYRIRFWRMWDYWRLFFAPTEDMNAHLNPWPAVRRAAFEMPSATAVNPPAKFRSQFYRNFNILYGALREIL